MAKRILSDLRPNDTVWSLYQGKIEEHKIFSISIDQIETSSRFICKIKEGDLTVWVFEGKNKYDSKQTFHVNKLDVLRLRHVELEKDLEATYERQKQYFESIIAKNKAFYESNLEIIKELR